MPMPLVSKIRCSPRESALDRSSAMENYETDDKPKKKIMPPLSFLVDGKAMDLLQERLTARYQPEVVEEKPKKKKGNDHFIIYDVQSMIAKSTLK